MMSPPDAYRVVTARSGWDEIERLKRRSTIDLAVVEHRLPVMPGVYVMKEIEDVKS